MWWYSDPIFSNRGGVLSFLESYQIFLLIYLRSWTADLTYCKGEKINLRKYYNEKCLQDRIEEDPTILNLGDLTIIERERRQSSGGRLDFLFLDPKTQTMYETEIIPPLGGSRRSDHWLDVIW